MKLRWMLVSLFIIACAASAQEDEMTLDDLIESGQQWLRDNVDESVLESLGELDEEALANIAGELQQRMGEVDVTDLAALQKTADALLRALDQHEETKSYAAWLRAHQDYFTVAEELRQSKPRPPVKPGEPPPPLPPVPPAVQRQVWQKQLTKRPVPPAAQLYVSRLKPIFVAQRVPAELVWLAEVESGFDPRARSPVGATGLYQLMPATAQQLGLRLRPKDERLVPERNAQAAAKYLNYLYGRFKDWQLALAAYNAGEGRVGRLLAKHKATTFDEIASRLPAETQMYVPKFEATLQRREGVALAKLVVPRGKS